MNAKQILNTMSLERLIEQWNLVSKMEMGTDIATVRGWILEALEAKAPEQMDKYYSDFYEDEDLERIVLNK